MERKGEIKNTKDMKEGIEGEEKKKASLDWIDIEWRRKGGERI